MNSVSLIQLVHMLINTPAQVEQLKAEREMAYECIKQRQCISVWDNSINEFVVYRIDNLREVCGNSQSESKVTSDLNGACNRYYQFLNKKRE